MGGVNVEMCVEGVNVGWAERSGCKIIEGPVGDGLRNYLNAYSVQNTVHTYVGQSCVPALITRSTLSGAPTVCSWLLDVWT